MILTTQTVIMFSAVDIARVQTQYPAMYVPLHFAAAYTVAKNNEIAGIQWFYEDCDGRTMPCDPSEVEAPDELCDVLELAALDIVRFGKRPLWVGVNNASMLDHYTSVAGRVVN